MFEDYAESQKLAYDMQTEFAIDDTYASAHEAGYW